MKLNVALQTIIATGTWLGLQVIGAIAMWIIGRWLIRVAVRLVARVLNREHTDATLVRYACSIVSVVLDILLIIAILGFFGVQTTSFAAILAAAGIAIGAAWSGLLGNFAAGVFLIIFKPFKVGDFVTAGGVTGTIEEVGLFVTTINAPDNVRNIVANNKILGDTIQNFSANPYRRVELTAQLAHSVVPNDAIKLLKAALTKIPNILSNPAPDVEILEFNPAGPMLAVRPYCNNQHYWQVYFDTNRLIRETFGEAGYPAAEQPHMVRRAG
ncbi:MAG TPA: mechanosensitive ion channel family protein [Candidatus Binataceae bacterium]|nr:mechanosensitive ion channel family protein [Candidatus Binataceae bacterium]